MTIMEQGRFQYIKVYHSADIDDYSLIRTGGGKQDLPQEKGHKEFIMNGGDQYITQWISDHEGIRVVDGIPVERPEYQEEQILKAIEQLDIQKRESYRQYVDHITAEIERKKELAIMGVMSYTDEEYETDVQLLYEKTLMVQQMFATEKKAIINKAPKQLVKELSKKERLYNIDRLIKLSKCGFIMSLFSILGLLIWIGIQLFYR